MQPSRIARSFHNAWLPQPSASGGFGLVHARETRKSVVQFGWFRLNIEADASFRSAWSRPCGTKCGRRFYKPRLNGVSVLGPDQEGERA